MPASRRPRVRPLLPASALVLPSQQMPAVQHITGGGGAISLQASVVHMSLECAHLTVLFDEWIHWSQVAIGRWRPEGMPSFAEYTEQHRSLWQQPKWARGVLVMHLYISLPWHHGTAPHSHRDPGISSASWLK
jgi:hypothetical protein